MARDFVFIATAGQAGATFLGRNLGDLIYDCRSAHEPDRPRWRRRRLSKTTRAFGVLNAYRHRHTTAKLARKVATGRLDPAAAGRALAAIRARYHRSLQERLVVESHHAFWPLGEALLSAWPQAKIVAVIRDPREWVGAVGDAPPTVAVTPRDIGDDEAARLWSGWSPLARKLWRWRMVHERLTALADAHENVRIWRYEDIFARDIYHFSELVAWAATHGGRTYPTQQVVGRTDAFFTVAEEMAPDWRRWPPEDARLAEEICGPLMARWGYGGEPEWKALIS